jgi:glycosyltransferase involved in cell wall biosynthesis
MFPCFLQRGIIPVVVCSYRRREGVHDAVEKMGIEVQLLEGSGLASRALALARLIRRERPALVHTAIFHSDLMGRVAAIGTGIPVLTSLVNTSYDPLRFLDPKIRPARLRTARAIDGFTARHLTTWFHALTETVRADSVSALGIDPERVTVIGRGRDPERLRRADPARRQQVRASLGLATTDEVILNVGRQEYQKGQTYLLEAADRVLRERPQAVVLIAGREGSSTRQLQGIHANLPTRERIRFLGHRDDVPELLCAADLFVFPSLYEGMGGAIIEAMAVGVPVIASRLPTLQEVVTEGETATLVEPASAESLALAITAMLNDADRRRAYAEEGRRIFLERFTLERAANRMADLLFHVAEMRRSPR